MLLNRKIETSREEGRQFDYHWRCKKTKLTHLCFADDLLLFCGKSMHSIGIIHQTLAEFYAMSGLRPNEGKSNIFIAGRHVNFQEAVRELFNYQVGELPVRYLGIPLISTKLNALHCKPLVDRITARATSWTARVLSFAGRLQLIQATLYGIFLLEWFVCASKVSNSEGGASIEKVLVERTIFGTWGSKGSLGGCFLSSEGRRAWN